MAKRLVYLFLIVLFSFIESQAQTRFTVRDAINLIGRRKSVVYDTLSKRYYGYKSKDGNIESFERSRNFGYSTLNVAFINNVLNNIAYSQSILYSGRILSEITSTGFKQDDELSSSQVFFFHNRIKHLSLTLFDHSSQGYFYVVIGPLAKNAITPTDQQRNASKMKVELKGKVENPGPKNKPVMNLSKPKAVLSRSSG